jgi:hypothetical protein
VIGALSEFGYLDQEKGSRLAFDLRGCFLRALGYGCGHEKPKHHLLYLHYLLTFVRRTASLFLKQITSDRSAEEDFRVR